jgi:CRP-like cAMP-binding protein
MHNHSPLADFSSVIAILSKISFLGGVSDAQRDTLFRYFETAHFAKGEYVARRGETPSHIYIIQSGRINLLIESNGASVIKREFCVGDCFGEAAFLSLINNTASFVAAEDCDLIVLSRNALNQLRKEDPDLFCILILNLARELARKLQYTDEMLIHLDSGGTL